MAQDQAHKMAPNIFVPESKALSFSFGPSSTWFFGVGGRFRRFVTIHVHGAGRAPFKFPVDLHLGMVAHQFVGLVRLMGKERAGSYLFRIDTSSKLLDAGFHSVESVVGSTIGGCSKSAARIRHCAKKPEALVTGLQQLLNREPFQLRKGLLQFLVN
jgi:hypothetical protein